MDTNVLDQSQGTKPNSVARSLRNTELPEYARDFLNNRPLLRQKALIVVPWHWIRLEEIPFESSEVRTYVYMKLYRFDDVWRWCFP